MSTVQETPPVWTLHLLGEGRLLDENGVAVAALLRQPRRFALLAYLAAAGDGSAAHSRDTLQALFWPEYDQARARNALAQALHYLRQQLPGVLLARGRSAVAIASECLACDVTRLKRAADAGHETEVVTLYAGALLPGFFIAEAPEFERWLEGERARVAQLAATAAAHLAEVAGDANALDEAVRWARRALEIVPDDEPAVRRLLSLLDRAGDRVGALALDASFRRRLADEYASEPSAETEALVRTIRVRHLGRSLESAPAPSSVAVLPFQELSAAPGDAYFADGLTEELIAMLAGVEGLHVVSRTSAFAYRHSAVPLRQIGRELGVETIVEGSVRRAGERVRITAQLIDARTDAHLWAESYERSLTDIFEIQYDVAQRIATSMRSRFTPEQGQRAAARAAHDPDAFHHYLRARHLCSRGSPEVWEQGIAAFHDAIAVDPQYAAAYAGLADAYLQPSLFNLGPPISRREARQHARRAAQRAIEIADDLAEAHATLGMVQFYDWEWAASEASLLRAVALQPASAHMHHRRGVCLIYLGRFDEADAELARAQQLDPLSLPIFISRGLLASRARRYDDAILLLRRALDIDPEAHAALHFLSEAYAYSGRHDLSLDVWERRPDLARYDVASVRKAFTEEGIAGARRAIVALLEASGGSPSIRATNLARLGDLDSAFALLDQACAERDTVLAEGVRVHPGFDSVRGDPRFRAILARMGVPESEALARR
jgi:TolB-like protein/Tfp pilus assembly protein PilF